VTDNPSSSVPVSKGEEIVARYAIDESTAALLALQIDSALASQEARLREESRARYQALLANRNRWMDRALKDEARHRQEMEKAKGDRDNWKAEFDLLFGVSRSDAEAAEQREREAGDKLKLLADAAAHLQGERCALAMARIMGDATVEQVQAVGIAGKALDAALAAIRSAPSPVSAPPTEPFHEQGILHVCKHGRGCDEPPSPSCGPGCAPYDEAQAASPVEPGSAPAEKEKEK
jgi:hypothetical protein